MNTNSLLTRDRLDVIEKLIKQCKFLEGSVAELGVYKGGTASLIAQHLFNKPFHLFDTFQGIPFKGENDKHNVGDFKDTTLDDVKEYLKNYKNIQYHVGIFPSTIPTELYNEKFCFVHLDADQYQSTKDALEFFYPRMVKDGIIVFDDYLWHACPGVEIAINEFMVDKPEKIVNEVNYQAYLVKK